HQHQQPPDHQQGNPLAGTINSHLTDEYVLLRCREGVTAGTFVRLYDHGDLSDFGDDWSSGDWALCRLIAFWTGPDAHRIHRLWSDSVLARREKFEQRPGYRVKTIEKRLREMNSFYTGNPMRSRGGDTEPHTKKSKTVLHGVVGGCAPPR